MDKKFIAQLISLPIITLLVFLVARPNPKDTNNTEAQSAPAPATAERPVPERPVKTIDATTRPVAEQPVPKPPVKIIDATERPKSDREIRSESVFDFVVRRTWKSKEGAIASERIDWLIGVRTCMRLDKIETLTKANDLGMFIFLKKGTKVTVLENKYDIWEVMIDGKKMYTFDFCLEE